MKRNNQLNFLSVSLIITVVFLTIYFAVQQSYRSAANDPQRQYARDMRDRIRNNQSIESMMSRDTLDLRTSLGMFTTLYNEKFEPIRSTGLLDGKFPSLPKGVLEYARDNQENTVTWQPRKGIRMAMVIDFVQTAGTSFVACGRSLTETENNVSNLSTMLIVGWLISIAIVTIWLSLRSELEIQPHGEIPHRLGMEKSIHFPGRIESKKIT